MVIDVDSSVVVEMMVETDDVRAVMLVAVQEVTVDAGGQTGEAG